MWVEESLKKVEEEFQQQKETKDINNKESV
jgi:hypothetical protein